VFAIAGTDLDGGPAYVTGRVSASRFPEYHPGNLRVLSAVVPPSGSALAVSLSGRGEVVVFATVGCRAEMDRMGGGDHDGDECLIVWDQQLIPRSTVEPHSYIAASPPSARTCEPLADVATLSAAALQRAVTPSVWKLHHAWLLFAGRSPDDLFTVEAAKLDQLVNQELDATKTGSHICLRELDKLMEPHFGARWLKERWNFMCLESKHDVLHDARVSKTAAGQIAAAAAELLQVSSRAARESKGGWDVRLVRIYEDMTPIFPEEAKAELLRVYGAFRQRAGQVMATVEARRKGPSSRRTVANRRSVTVDGESEGSDKNPWESYIVAFRVALIEVAATYAEPMRRVSLCIYAEAPAELRRGTFPWCVIGDYLLEELVLHEMRLGAGVWIPANKLHLLQAPHAAGAPLDPFPR